MKGYRQETTEESGRYRFIAEFDGPNRWPAPVELMVKGIGFETNQTLVWPINWAKYRTRTESKPMDEEDRVAVRFYDSTLISWITTEQGVSIMADPPAGKPPYVQAQLQGSGRGVEGTTLRPGFEVANEAGDRMTNMVGGGGSDGLRERTSALWWDGLIEPFRQSDRLTLRYVNPGAVMKVDETWVLVAE